MSDLSQFPLLIYTDSKCKTPVYTIPDYFNSYRQCAQDSLLVYPSPVTASCELANVTIPTVKVGLCPPTLSYTVSTVDLKEGCREIAQGDQIYYISQGCTEAGFEESKAVVGPPPSEEGLDIPKEPIGFLSLSSATWVAVGIVVLALLFACCCAAFWVKKMRKRRDNNRLRKIIRNT